MNPRISPKDNPTSFLMKLMFIFMKKHYGKVLMPARVIYSRYPKIGMFIKKLYDTEKSLKLVQDNEKFLIQNLVATLNGCTFCMDISKRNAVNKQIGLEKFYDLMNYKKSDQYSTREKAIFQYVEEMTGQIIVSDKTYGILKQFCSDEEIIEITYVAASENYLNRLIKPLQIGSDELCKIR